MIPVKVDSSKEGAQASASKTSFLRKVVIAFFTIAVTLGVFIGLAVFVFPQTESEKVVGTDSSISKTLSASPLTGPIHPPLSKSVAQSTKGIVLKYVAEYKIAFIVLSVVLGLAVAGGVIFLGISKTTPDLIGGSHPLSDPGRNQGLAEEGLQTKSEQSQTGMWIGVGVGIFLVVGLAVGGVAVYCNRTKIPCLKQPSSTRGTVVTQPNPVPGPNSTATGANLGGPEKALSVARPEGENKYVYEASPDFTELKRNLGEHAIFSREAKLGDSDSAEKIAFVSHLTTLPNLADALQRLSVENLKYVHGVVCDAFYAKYGNVTEKFNMNLVPTSMSVKPTHYNGSSILQFMQSYWGQSEGSLYSFFLSIIQQVVYREKKALYFTLRPICRGRASYVSELRNVNPDITTILLEIYTTEEIDQVVSRRTEQFIYSISFLLDIWTHFKNYTVEEVEFSIKKISAVYPMM
jgi:hypothetical protein